MSQNAPGKAFCRGISLIEPMDIFPTCGLKTHTAPASPPGFAGNTPPARPGAAGRSAGRSVTPLRLERGLIPPPKKINALLSTLIRIWR